MARAHEKHNQQQLEVLILVDNFETEMTPMTANKSWGFNRFYMYPYIDICLDWISRLDSPNVIVAFANQSNEVASKLQTRWSNSIKNLQIISVQNCQSQNDVLREVEARHLLSGDFLLVHNCATFCSSNLATQIENFRLRRRQNKNNIVTLLYTEQPQLEEQHECEFQQKTLLAYHIATQKLVYYIKNSQIPSGKLQLSKKNFLTETMFRTDLKPSGLMLCAYEFSAHFAGNHDFNSIDNILHDILSNEEFLCCNIHVDILPEMDVEQRILCIDNFPALIDVHRQLLARKCFPLTFENVFADFAVTGLKDTDQLQHCKERNLYLSRNSTGRLDDLLKNGNLHDAVFGHSWKVSANATVEWATFGKCAQIENGSFLRDVICGNNVLIEERARVECSMLGNNVRIGADAIVGNYCLLGDNVEVLANTKLEAGTILVNGKPTTKWENFVQPTVQNSESDDDGTNEQDGIEKEPVDVTYQGNFRAFVAEVLESMQSILEDIEQQKDEREQQREISQEQIDNIKLEINGSKIAYNISLDEMPRLLFHAFLSLSGVTERFVDFKKQFNEWSNFWNIYFRRAAFKMSMLHALEEYSTEHEHFQRLIPNVLHWLNQEKEFIADEQILRWHTALAKDSPLHNVPKLTEFIEWLQNDEDSEEAEENDG